MLLIKVNAKAHLAEGEFFCISKTTHWTRGSVKALPMSRN